MATQCEGCTPDNVKHSFMSTNAIQFSRMEELKRSSQHRQDECQLISFKYDWRRSSSKHREVLNLTKEIQ